MPDARKPGSTDGPMSFMWQQFSEALSNFQMREMHFSAFCVCGWVFPGQGDEPAEFSCPTSRLVWLSGNPDFSGVTPITSTFSCVLNVQ